MPSNEARVILSHQAALKQVRSRVDAYAVHTWRGLGSWRDDDIDRFVARVVPVVESGQRQTSRLTNAYLDSMARLAGMPTPPRAPLPLNPRGVALTEVYRRPAVTVYTALSEGLTLDDAVALGEQRVSALVAMDAQLANVHAAFARLSNDENIVGYERVLAGGESCALCAIASTQVYHSGDLMPIHDHCECDVVPIYGSRDAVDELNTERYMDMREQLTAQGVEYSGGGFKADRSIRIQAHGEYGPVLTWADQSFTGPGDIPK